jgi:hypothetical protein
MLSNHLIYVATIKPLHLFYRYQTPSYCMLSCAVLQQQFGSDNLSDLAHKETLQTQPWCTNKCRSGTKGCTKGDGGYGGGTKGCAKSDWGDGSGTKGCAKSKGDVGGGNKGCTCVIT